MGNDTFFNKIILICVLFLIGMTLIDGLKKLIPKTREGLVTENMSTEATIHKHTGQISMLKDELDIVGELKEKITKLQTISKGNTKQIEELIKTNGANAAAKSANDALKPK
jgi:hypothetical protein